MHRTKFKRIFALRMTETGTLSRADSQAFATKKAKSATVVISLFKATNGV